MVYTIFGFKVNHKFFYGGNIYTYAARMRLYCINASIGFVYPVFNAYIIYNYSDRK
nr:MAG TPA: hypothetical protein [Bacteriophage sp.]